ncbi:Trm112 family protein, partial [Micromonospora sp. D75]|nr:Trm112 family protein [Micromonospora sp. D75]
TCTECGRIFEVRDDVPVLLLDEARGGPAADEARGGSSR